ncbi:F0F1 ATP synthase subunit A [Phycisphaerales bacterium AB-hyl4]|uniref:ATP synthase subunit a n=1 Tax=Natronomicrosphaera hydrolytica TaxID=3242702 RepID=A0ABV4U7L9_9BACT
MLSPMVTLILASDEMMDRAMGHVLPYTLFEIPGLGISFTNHMFMVLTASVLVYVVFAYTARQTRTGTTKSLDDYTTDGKFAQFFETICQFIRDNVVKPQLGGMTDRYIPYIWTVFFFIMFSNLLGMIPIGSIVGGIAFALNGMGISIPQYHGWYAHWWGTSTGNIAVTSALASVSLVAIIGIGIREQGTKYFAHFAPVPFKPIGMAPVALLLVALEIIGLLVKCGVLAMRLFGVMVGGHLVIGVMLGMIFLFGSYIVGVGMVLLTLGLSILELFIALLQAFIFTFLTTLFIAAGAAHHEHDEHHDHDDELEHGVEPVAAEAHA